MTVSVLRLFLTVPWVGLHCETVVFPGHTHLFFQRNDYIWTHIPCHVTAVAYCDETNIEVHFFACSIAEASNSEYSLSEIKSYLLFKFCC